MTEIIIRLLEIVIWKLLHPDTTEIAAMLGVVIALLTMLVTFLYTVVTFFLWLSARKTTQLNSEMVNYLSKQVAHQLALSYTTTEHNIIDSHRELYLSILQSPTLLETFADEAGLQPDYTKKNLLGTLMINHCSATFIHYESNVLNNPELLESYIRDSRDMFQMKFVRDRWEAVKQYHPKSFRDFVDNVVLANIEPPIQKPSEIAGSSTVDSTPIRSGYKSKSKDT